MKLGTIQSFQEMSSPEPGDLVQRFMVEVGYCSALLDVIQLMEKSESNISQLIMETCGRK
jgi:hypothetical protein